MAGIRGEKYIDENGNKVITGGLLAAQTNMERYGKDFYSRIGSKGGKAIGIKGFAAMPPEKRREAGRKGGSKSTRLGIHNGEGKKQAILKNSDVPVMREVKEEKKKGFLSRLFN